VKSLFEYLEGSARTLTVYEYAGTETELEQLTELLDSYGVRMQTVTTEAPGPENVAVLHQNGEILDACSVDALLSHAEFEGLMQTEQQARPTLLSKLSPAVAVKPTQTVTEMVRISREYERRALREGGGTLHAGFQQLSQIAISDRTMEMYTALASEGVDVNVCGYPNTALGDVPFTVIEDTNGELDAYWYLLYDGNGNPDRKAALVSEERPTGGSEPESTDKEPVVQSERQYDCYFTTDRETVDTLFDLASSAHGELLGLTD
jgi:hypothetical protein